MPPPFTPPAPMWLDGSMIARPPAPGPAAPAPAPTPRAGNPARPAAPRNPEVQMNPSTRKFANRPTPAEFTRNGAQFNVPALTAEVTGQPADDGLDPRPVTFNLPGRLTEINGEPVPGWTIEFTQVTFDQGNTSTPQVEITAWAGGSMITITLSDQGGRADFEVTPHDAI